jgi:enoyl-CoA hydratase
MDILTSSAQAVTTLQFNRPQRRNALTAGMYAQLVEAVQAAEADDGVRVIVLRGSADVFTAGNDIADFVERPPTDFDAPVFRFLATVAHATKPLVAAVNGPALAGGFEIVLACDLVVAAENSTFGIPETKRGLIAGSGGLVRMPRRIPPAIAMEYALTGRTFTALDAHRWGMVNRLTPPGGALRAALELAAEISANAPFAVQMAKRVITESPSWPADEVWDRQRELLAEVIASPDAKEGAQAFVEKRAPRWQGG